VCILQYYVTGPYGSYEAACGAYETGDVAIYQMTGYFFINNNCSTYADGFYNVSGNDNWVQFSSGTEIAIADCTVLTPTPTQTQTMTPTLTASSVPCDPYGTYIGQVCGEGGVLTTLYDKYADGSCGYYYVEVCADYVGCGGSGYCA
jgi:hypothetical protein